MVENYAVFTDIKEDKSDETFAKCWNTLCRITYQKKILGVRIIKSKGGQKLHPNISIATM